MMPLRLPRTATVTARRRPQLWRAAAARAVLTRERADSVEPEPRCCLIRLLPPGLGSRTAVHRAVAEAGRRAIMMPMSKINELKMQAIKHSYCHSDRKWLKSRIHVVVESNSFQQGAMRSAVNDVVFTEIVFTSVNECLLNSIECGRLNQTTT
jgi:hypothetical protein